MEWNYEDLGTLSFKAELDSDSNLIPTANSDSATAASTKTLNVKGMVTPTDGQTDTDTIGLLGNAIAQVFDIVPTGNATLKSNAILEEED